MTAEVETKKKIKITDLTSIQTIFLFVLHKYPSITGKEIVEVIEREIGSDWTPTTGTIYKILSRLSEAGCIEETTQDTNPSDGRKRTYQLSSCGTDFVKQQSDRMLRLVGFLYDCCPEYNDTYRIVKICNTDKC